MAMILPDDQQQAAAGAPTAAIEGSMQAAMRDGGGEGEGEGQGQTEEEEEQGRGQEERVASPRASIRKEEEERKKREEEKEKEEEEDKQKKKNNQKKKKKKKKGGGRRNEEPHQEVAMAMILPDHQQQAATEAATAAIESPMQAAMRDGGEGEGEEGEGHTEEVEEEGRGEEERGASPRASIRKEEEEDKQKKKKKKEEEEEEEGGGRRNEEPHPEVAMAMILSDHQQQAAAGAPTAAIESSVDAAMRDEDLVGRIVAHLLSTYDRHSARLVCRAWRDAVAFEVGRLAIRSRTLPPNLVKRFWHVRTLDLAKCSDLLENADLKLVSKSFTRLKALIIGSPDLPQEKITKEGLQFFASSCNQLELLSLSSAPNVHDDGVCSLTQGCQFLKSLSLEDCRSLTDTALEAISRCSSLEELTLKGVFEFSPVGLAMIGKHCLRLLTVRLELGSLDVVPALKSISTGCCNIQEISLKTMNVDLRDLVECSSLTSLRVETNQLNCMDETVIAVSKVNNHLKELVFINGLAPLGDAAVLDVVHNCPNLEKLHIEAVRLTDISLLCLMGCKTLKCLALDHFKSTGHGLAEIGLCGFDLNDFSLRFGRGIRDMELETLMYGNQGLEHLDLYNCHGPSAIGFSSIGTCSQLQSLDLGFTNVDNVSLLAIAAGCRFLRRLDLVKCEALTDMEVISRFTSLEILNVDQCPFVTDEGLRHLAMGCRQLVNLSLALTRITDKGLFHLTKCARLRRLCIPYCRSVEGSGVIAVAKACSWFQYIVLSHRFRNSEVLEELKKQCCMVCLEMDDMALVPFDYNLIM